MNLVKQEKGRWIYNLKGKISCAKVGQLTFINKPPFIHF